jgi:hypothetical protein
MMRRLAVLSALVVLFNITNASAQMWEKNVCLGHVWIHRYMATITSKSNSDSDPLSCVFDPSSSVGKKVLRVCNEWGGGSKHGCYVKGTFRAIGKQRELTSVLDIQKTEGKCGNAPCEEN